MGRGFTSIPQRQATPEPPVPIPPGSGQVLGTTVLLGPLATQDFTGEGFETLLFPEAEPNLIQNSLGLKFDELGSLLFPEDGVYIVTLSIYPVYSSGTEPEWRNIEIVNTSTQENAMFDMKSLTKRTNENITGEQLTCMVQINGGSKSIQFDFQINGASAETPVHMIVEELIVVGIA